MAKGVRERIRLIFSTGIGHFYITMKNRCTKLGKLELKRFDPVVCQRVIYKEAKVKQFPL